LAILSKNNIIHVEFAISSTTVDHKGKEGSKEVPIYGFWLLQKCN
jgi:hypothetical protein